MPRLLRPLLVALAATLALPAAADTLDQVRKSGTFTIGYRTDAPPFSFQDTDGKPVGYSVDLCERIAAAVKQAAGTPQMRIKYERVTAQNRFDALAGRKIDILCEGTTATLGRRERVDFTLLTFLSGGGLMVRAAAPLGSFSELNGRKVGVLKGTTTETGLRRSLQDQGIAATVVAVDSHDQGAARLQAGEIDAYFGDRELLVGLANRPGAGQGLLVADEYLSFEPYALAIGKGEQRLRLIADRTLAALYRSNAIREVFAKWLPGAQPSQMLRTMFLVQALPE